MRGDQLTWEWGGTRVSEGSPSSFALAEIALRKGPGLWTIHRHLEFLQAAEVPLYAQRGDKANRPFFLDSFKFGIPSPFPSAELTSFHLNQNLSWFPNGDSFSISLNSMGTSTV